MATRATKRPLNKCGSCGHTWYPKGRSLSVRCPECRSTDTKKAGAGVGAVVLFLAALAVFGGKKESHPTPDVQSTGASGAQVTQPVIAASSPEPTLNDANLSGTAVSDAGEAKPTADSTQARVSTLSDGLRADTTVASPEAAIAPEAASDVALQQEREAVTAPTLPPVRDREHH
ncbi:conserved hypothetical protein [Paraburkholderia ribeironis]|uniref:Uncharacterized protein n=1 Tax=Paraburkholderia ribeironis TaxID=1247936 RepID=A0A1N7SD15_9BURK|nr:conserved hypothetical protein [Paraburkholderia ribeironis]